MTRPALAVAAVLVAVVGAPAAAQQERAAVSQLAKSVVLDLRRLGYDVAPEDLTRIQLTQLHFLLDDVPLFGLDALRGRQRIETILASPDGAGSRF